MFLQLLAETNWSLGIGVGCAAVGAGVVTIGAGMGISKIASASVESIARQPEASGDIRAAMILTAALIEGVALFATVVCLLSSISVSGKMDSADHGSPATNAVSNPK